VVKSITKNHFLSPILMQILISKQNNNNNNKKNKKQKSKKGKEEYREETL